MLVSLLVLLGVVVSTGCQAEPSDPTRQPVESPPPTQPPVEPTTGTVQPVSPTRSAAAPDRAGRIATRLPERFSPAETVLPVTGEVPNAILAAILADLEKRSGIAADQIRVVRGQNIIWNDGSLGCPKPGMMYTQALVNGYWVVLEAGGQEYDYRVGNGDAFFLCESGAAPITPGGPPAK